MFYLFKKLRQALRTLRSETSPHEISLGAAFGILLGFPPFGVQSLLPLIPILLFRNAIGNALLFAAVARLLAWPLATVSFDTGVALLRDSDTLRGVMTALTNAPFFGLLGLNRYYVFGSFALAIPLAIVAYLAMRLFVSSFRARVIDRVSGLERVQRNENKFWFKLGRWVFLGGQVKPVKQPQGIWRIFRKATVLGFPIVLVVLTGGAMLATQFGLGSAVEAAIGAASGAPTRVESSWANPLRQRVGLNGLFVDDPQTAAKPMLQVSDVHFDLDMLALMSGRLLVPELMIRGATLRLVRRPDGSLAIADAPVATGRPAEGGEPPSEAENDYLAWVKEHAKDADWLEIGSRTLEFVRERIAASKKAEEERQVLGFDPWARERYEADQPFFRLDRVAFADFAIEIEDQRPGHEEKLPTLHTATFELRNLSSNRALRGEDLVAELVANLGGPELGTFALESDWLAPGKGSEGGDLRTHLHLDRIDLPGLASLFETSIPVGVERGRLSFDSGLTLSAGNIAPTTGDLRFDELQLAQPAPGQKLLGLDAEATRWFVDGLNAVAAEEPLAMTAFVDGTVERPNVRVEANLLAIAKRGVEKLALQRGRAEAERILGQLDGALQSQLGELGALGASLGGEASAALQRDVLGPLLQGDPGAIDTEKLGESAGEAARKAAEEAAAKALEDTLKGSGLEKQGENLQKGLEGLFGGKKEEKKDKNKKNKEGGGD